MTSSDWHDGPIATWIRNGLDARGKNRAWLARQIAADGRITKDSAEQNVHRWTVQGQTPKKSEYRALLERLFGPMPGAAGTEAYRDQERRIGELEEGQGLLMQLAIAAGPARRPLIAQLQERLRRQAGGQ